MSVETLVGHTIKSISLATDKKAIRFTLEDADRVFLTDGDCCSNSWIAHVEGITYLLGAKVIAVEWLNMRREEDGELKIYGTKIITENGTGVLDFRNESNGYYGGSLVEEGDANDYFYGGVYGQNVSTKIWKTVEEDF